MIDFTAIFIVGIVFGSIYGLFFLFIRRSERLAMLEKGADPAIFKQTNKEVKFNSLRYGFLLMGLGTGFLFGNILVEKTEMPQEISYFSMLFLFGGLALILGYLVEKRERKEQTAKKQD